MRKRILPCEKDAEFRARALLHSAPGMGPAKVNALIGCFTSARAILEASDSRLSAVRGIGMETVRKLRRHAASYHHDDTKDRDLDLALDRGYRLLMSGDYEFPKMLTRLYSCPPFLWLHGDLKGLSGPAVAVVGTRRPSPEARIISYKLGFALAAAGYTVVSGLAYGIDVESHKGALDAGGSTVAVLGSGLLRIYPATHRSLAQQIGGSGAVISEFTLRMKAIPGHFPRRNRIISGMCIATVVVEAYERGGALITARLALDQNREVFAFPGSPANPAATGTNRLIQTGEAQLVLNTEEVIADLGEIVKKQVDQDCQPVRISMCEQRVVEPLHRTQNNTRTTSAATMSEAVSTVATDREKRLGMGIIDFRGTFPIAELVQELADKPLHLDEIRHRFEDRCPATLLSLLKLENQGVVRRLPGGYFTVTGR